MTIPKNKPGKWIVQKMRAKGYCRNCWKKFDREFPGETIQGFTLEDMQTMVGNAVRCCPVPDIRFVPADTRINA